MIQETQIKDRQNAPTLIGSELSDNLHLLPAPGLVVRQSWPRKGWKWNSSTERSLLPASLPDYEKARLKEESLSLDKVYEDLISSGRGSSLVNALVAHPDNFDPAKDRKWLKLAKMLSDPANAHIEFSLLCAKLKINVREIIPYFIDFQRAVAMFKIAESTPDLAAQTMLAGLSKETYCEKCRGKGKVWEAEIGPDGYQIVDRESKKAKLKLETCIDCNGSGKKERQPEEKAREAALEISGLAGKGKQPVIIQQNNYSGLEETMTDIGKVLSGG